MLDLLGFRPQCSDIELQGLHEEALYMTFNCCHDLRGRITDQHFHFVHRARNRRPKDLPLSGGIIDRRGVRRELLAYIRYAAGLMPRLGNHQHTKPYGGQMDRGDIGGIVIALLLEKAPILFGFLEVHLNCPAHRIQFQYAMRLKVGVRSQEYRPVMLTGLRFFLRSNAANE